MKEELLKKIATLDRQIAQEKAELKKSLDMNNILEYTNINSSRLVFLQGKKEALLDVLELIK